MLPILPDTHKQVSLCSTMTPNVLIHHALDFILTNLPCHIVCMRTRMYATAGLLNRPSQQHLHLTLVFRSRYQLCGL